MSWTFEILAQPTNGLTEGPAWDGSGLLYSNIPNSRVMRYDPASGQISVWREGTNKANGLMLDSQGRLYVADSSNNRMLVFKPPF